MWSISKIVGLLLFLMVGVSVLGSLQTLKTESVDENYNAMDSLLESRQNDIIIEQDNLEAADEHPAFTSSRPGREIIKDGIIVNQLSALSCAKAGDLINGYMLYGYLGERNKTEDENQPYYPVRVNYSIYEGVSEGDNHPYYAIAGRPPHGRAGNPLVERTPGYAAQFTDWNPSCTGMQKTSDFVTDPVGAMWDSTVSAVATVPSDTFEFFTCESIPNWASRSGNDMEGRYGRTNFQISENVEEPIVLSSSEDKPDHLRSDRVWMANFAVKGGTCWAEVGVKALGAGVSLGAGAISGNPAAGVMAAGAIAASGDYEANELQIIPTMAGVQWSSYAPYHSKIIDGDRDWNTDDLDLRKGHVVVDAPMYLQGGNAVDHITDEDLGTAERSLRIRERARYVLCPGTEGYIQTNREANGREGGEHTVDAENPGIGATHITTYIRITSEDPGSCMEGSEIGNVRYDEGIVFDFYPDGCKDEYNRC